MPAIRSLMLVAVGLAVYLLGIPTATADSGDETLRGWLERSDLVVDATVKDLNGPRQYELGVAHYAPTLEVHAVLKGRLAPSEGPFRAEIIRYELDEQDRPPYLRAGARIVLFLKASAEGNVPRYETTDMWFGVQRYGSMLVRRLAALGQSVAEPTKTVKAQHYRMIYAESALDLSHGGGRWADALFLPEARVVAMLVHDHEIEDAPPSTPVDIRPRVRLFAFHADGPRIDLTGLRGTPSPIEEIDVPADLAGEIIALASLTERQQSESARLGKLVAGRLGWSENPSSRSAPERPRPAAEVGAAVPSVDPDHPGAASVTVTARLPGGAAAHGPLRVRWATDAPGSGHSLELAAGASGTRLAGLPAGRVWVEATVQDGTIEAFAAAVWLVLQADHHTDVGFDFDRGHSVRGRLLDHLGRPVQNREVTFSEPTEPPLEMMFSSTRTDAYGRFCLVGLPRRAGSLSILIPRARVGPQCGPSSQAVEFQMQTVENVTPGGEPLEIEVREFEPGRETGGGG